MDFLDGAKTPVFYTERSSHHVFSYYPPLRVVNRRSIYFTLQASEATQYFIHNLRHAIFYFQVGTSREPDPHISTFKGSTAFLPSSTRAETMAILITLIVRTKLLLLFILIPKISYTHNKVFNSFFR